MSARYIHAIAAGALMLAGSTIVLARTQVARAEMTPSAASPVTKESAAANTSKDAYSYDPQGRRDPFVSLLGRGESSAAPAGRRGDGVQGLTTEELSIKGVLQHRNGYVAIVQGPDQKTHLLRANDRIADGMVKAITPQGIVILQEVNDPLSLVKQKEIRKTLQGSEEK